MNPTTSKTTKASTASTADAKKWSRVQDPVAQGDVMGVREHFIGIVMGYLLEQSSFGVNIDGAAFNKIADTAVNCADALVARLETTQVARSA